MCMIFSLSIPETKQTMGMGQILQQRWHRLGHFCFLSPLSYVPSFSFLFLAKSALRVCLFEGEIWWIENFREEIGRNFFLEYVWLGGNEGK